MQTKPTRGGREETRLAILRAARDVILERGGFVSMDQIVDKAGISKGGLLYHFPDKDSVIEGVAEFAIDAWRAGVLALAESSTASRGRLLDAYVRACFDTELGANRIVLSRSAMLGPRSRIERLVRADADRWRSDLVQDGIAEDIRLVVAAAADAAMVTPFGSSIRSGEESRHLRRFLLAMVASGATRIRQDAVLKNH